MEAPDTRPLTIGEFGRRSGLSVKALRLYDLSGLLPPDHVDPASGYRRYAPEQLDRARLISLLRRLDMPLAVVAEVLAAGEDEALVRLDRWWAAQEESMQARRGTLEWLRGRLARADEPRHSHPVLRRAVPDTKVAALRRETDQQGLVEAIRAGEWELREHLAPAGARTTAEHWVIFQSFVTPDSEAEVEVCVPFTGPVEPAGRIAIRVEAAHEEAYTVVTRDDCWYPRIMHAYDAVEEHIAATGVPAGPAREVYIACWGDIQGTDPFVYVAQPVANG
ncbi:MerR family transcriptional regulator [Spirilliplanes yamanashiensis]|uniref:MerR family transcriptional regulator n=1 Tax=Spirilliplanes yamanashiensis TaxID=42233 RepID=A0A8J4DHA1_9ACTN|nr:helix-turn-helix domain-containing protein [Spirilliplanes yamanashiensis]MDP9819472.1 DNA-binding transcriptional MerR regulator [Spirilliplanes yamanashiensis]GIJ01706.1 MerR family transcriptional regulator [Spirilliplanes yamanashiensis]